MSGQHQTAYQIRVAYTGLNYVKATYRSINGMIETSWKKAGKTVVLTIAVPVNTIATLFIPTTNPAAILGNDKAIKTNPAITIKEFKDGYLQIEVGSGTYQFTSQN